MDTPLSVFDFNKNFNRFLKFVLLISKGDTLFIGGCGRFIEGDANDMHKALIDKIGTLPPETRIFCGHEYTVANFNFCLKMEPDNQKTVDKLQWAKMITSKGGRTVPSTIADEFETNVFMRVNVPEIQNRTGTEGDPIATMGALRELKNKS